MWQTNLQALLDLKTDAEVKASSRQPLAPTPRMEQDGSLEQTEEEVVASHVPVPVYGAARSRVGPSQEQMKAPFVVDVGQGHGGVVPSSNEEHKHLVLSWATVPEILAVSHHVPGLPQASVGQPPLQLPSC